MAEGVGSAAHGLLAQKWQPPAGPLLLLGCGSGGLAAHFARDGREVQAFDLRLDDLNDAEAWRPRPPGLRFADTPLVDDLPAAAFASAAIVAPQARGLARRWMLAAVWAVAPGGVIALAGTNDGGIKALGADLAALCGAAAPAAFGNHARLVLAVRPTTLPPAPPWAHEPGVAPGSRLRFGVPTSDGSLELLSASGVFSHDQLDAGTALLLAHMPPVVGRRVLDLGCGTGVIGIVAARGGAAWVDLLDVNLAATQIAAENLVACGLAERASVIRGDGPASLGARRYDLILTNPPFHRARVTDYATPARFLREGLALLDQGGQLALVANSFLPYDKILHELGWQVRELAATKSYRVLLAERPSEG